MAASLLCALRDGGANEEVPELQSLRFALLFSGAKSRATTHRALYRKPIDVASLHVWGKSDKFVKSDLSEELVEKFQMKRRHTHVHEGGHYMPSDKHTRNIVCRFVLQMFDTACECEEKVVEEDDDGNVGWLRAAL